MDEFFADIEKHIERLGGGWAAYLVRALWNHPSGLDRQQVIDAVLEDALSRGRPIPRSFEGTIQATFQKHNRASNAFRGSVDEDLFEFVGGKGNGVWGLHRARALSWMARNARHCDFKMASLST